MATNTESTKTPSGHVTGSSKQKNSRTKAAKKSAQKNRPTAPSEGGEGKQEDENAMKEYAAHHPSFAAHHPSFAAHHPSSAAHHPSFAAHHPSFAAHPPSFAAHHPSFAAHHPSFAAHHPSF